MKFFLVLFTLAFSFKVFACAPGTRVEFYDCQGDNSLSKGISKKAGYELDKKMKKCEAEGKDCCINKTATKIATERKCKFKSIAPESVKN